MRAYVESTQCLTAARLQGTSKKSRGLMYAFSTLVYHPIKAKRVLHCDESNRNAALAPTMSVSVHETILESLTRSPIDPEA